MKKFKELKTAGQMVLFTTDPISENEVPEGFFCYNIKANEDGTEPVAIYNKVLANHYGSILTTKSFCLKDGECVPIRCYIWHFTGRELTPEEFVASQQEHNK